MLSTGLTHKTDLNKVFVLGFVFNNNLSTIVLSETSNPVYGGKLNGFGTSAQCIRDSVSCMQDYMTREFKYTNNWHRYGFINSKYHPGKQCVLMYSVMRQDQEFQGDGLQLIEIKDLQDQRADVVNDIPALLEPALSLISTINKRNNYPKLTESTTC